MEKKARGISFDLDQSKMGSYESLKRSNLVCSSPYGRIRHGSSKAQMCLAKILRIISSVPPDDATSKRSSWSPESRDIDEKKALFCGLGGSDVDLNITSGQMGESGSFLIKDKELSTINNGVGEVGGEVAYVPAKGEFPVLFSDEKSLEAECSPEDEVKPTRAQLSGVVKLDAESSDIDMHAAAKTTNEDEEIEAEVKEKTHQPDDVQCEETNSEGCIGLLIEAAKLIFGESKDQEPEPHHEPKVASDQIQKTIGIVTNEESSLGARKLKRRNNDHVWAVDLYGEIEDDDASHSPVVRSKRGRTQVLPYKYRDSVLEPLTPLSRRFRSSPANVSTKRRFIR